MDTYDSNDNKHCIWMESYSMSSSASLFLATSRSLSPFFALCVCYWLNLLITIEFIDIDSVYFRFNFISLHFFRFHIHCSEHSSIVSRCHLLWRSHTISLRFDCVCPNPNLIHRRKRLFCFSLLLPLCASISRWNWIRIPSPFPHWNAINFVWLFVGAIGIALSIRRFAWNVRCENGKHFALLLIPLR